MKTNKTDKKKIEDILLLDLKGVPTEEVLDQLLDFLESEKKKAREKELAEFVNYLKHWIRGNKKDNWHPILMDEFEAFLDIRFDDFINNDFEELLKRRTREIKLKEAKNG